MPSFYDPPDEREGSDKQCWQCDGQATGEEPYPDLCYDCARETWLADRADEKLADMKENPEDY
jgi:hypothetical protein